MQQTRVHRSIQFLICWLGVAPCLAIAAADPILGAWRTTDPDSGVTMVMQLYMAADRLEGRVLRVLNTQGQEFHPVCDRCPGASRNQSVDGMTFIRDLKQQGASWTGGRVIDVRPGATQGFEAWCELKVEQGRLRFMGYKWRWARGIPLLSRETFWDRDLPSER